MITALEIDVANLKDMMDAGAAFHLLDVREPWEVAAAAFPEHRHIPMNTLPGRLGDLPTDGPLIVACHHGQRSLMVVRWLREQGFDEAISLTGGIDAWAREIDSNIPTY